MVHFEANSLYSMDELEAMLEGVVSLHVFLENLALKKRGERIFRDAVFGLELLEGVKRAKESSDRSNSALRGTPRTGQYVPIAPPPSSAKQPAAKLSASDL